MSYTQETDSESSCNTLSQERRRNGLLQKLKEKLTSNRTRSKQRMDECTEETGDILGTHMKPCVTASWRCGHLTSRAQLPKSLRKRSTMEKYHSHCRRESRSTPQSSSETSRTSFTIPKGSDYTEWSSNQTPGMFCGLLVINSVRSKVNGQNQP